MQILILGGSGFLSGTLARRAVADGHRVTVVTRGQRDLPDGVDSIVVDRTDRPAFAEALSNRKADLVVDCIGFQRDDATQDLDVFGGRVAHLVFVSTDFVYDPAQRRFPEREEGGAYLQSDDYGGRKRRCELKFLESQPTETSWTVFRPGHIYGPGSRLGCLPNAARDPELVPNLQAGRPLQLVAEGRFLQQPVFAPDFAELILSVPGCDAARNRIFCLGGPAAIESVHYYQILADALEVELRVEPLDTQAWLAEHPQAAPFCCHRFYDLTALRSSGLKAPTTPLEVGLQVHLDSVLAEL